MIMVDELRIWTAKRPFHKGSCHLTTDGTIEELHAFADRIGMKREWFQKHPLASHYDLTPKMRAVAVELGAVEVSAREQARRRRAHKDGGASHGVVREEQTRAPVSSRQTSQPIAAPAAPKLYWYSANDRVEARDLLHFVLELYVEACTQIEEWDEAISTALGVATRRRLAAREVELLAFGHAQHATWKLRFVQVSRLLASAQTMFVEIHRPALSEHDRQRFEEAIAGKAAA